MTIKDKDGKEWVLVPKDGDWNMTKAALALITSSNINTGDLKIGTLAAAFENAIAAAPQFVPPAVTDEMAEKIDALWMSLSSYTDAESGRGMIAAVQQVLGPTLGLAPIDDATRKNAERYLWLRDESWSCAHESRKYPRVAQTVVIVDPYMQVTILAEDALDAAVDNARGGE